MKQTIRLEGHHHEISPGPVRALLKKHGNYKQKVAIWNAFVDSDLSGITEDDCHILPRVLPGAYLPVIKKTAHEVATFALRLLSLPTKEIEAIIPSGPIRDFLIKEIGVLKHRPKRLTGSFRFDMAIVGEPRQGNPPKLLEINEIGFDGLARSSFIQETLFKLIPELKNQAFALDTGAAEARNMRRLGTRFARFQDDDYNWEEEVLIQKARQNGVEMRLVSPDEFKFEKNSDLPLLSRKKISVRNGRVHLEPTWQPDAIQMGYSFRYQDYLEVPGLYRRLVASKTPQYGPFITNLVASKMILVLLGDPQLQKKLLGSTRSLNQTLLPAFSLRGHEKSTARECENLVLKHVDGLGGEMVFIGDDIPRQLKRISQRESKDWVVQQRTRLNTLDVRGILSRPRRVISDLGVFVHYDWSDGKFQNFEVGGFITRATNKGFKVNVSGGGLQVPVMFTR